MPVCLPASLYRPYRPTSTNLLLHPDPAIHCPLHRKGLPLYAARRNDAMQRDGVSRLSAYHHFGGRRQRCFIKGWLLELPLLWKLPAGAAVHLRALRALCCKPVHPSGPLQAWSAPSRLRGRLR